MFVFDNLCIHVKMQNLIKVYLKIARRNKQKKRDFVFKSNNNLKNN